MYSIDFLNEDWSGAGHDLALCVVFRGDALAPKSVSDFIDRVAEKETVNAIKAILAGSDDRWQSFSRAEIVARLRQEPDWNSIYLIVLSLTTRHGFNGYIEVNTPNQLVIGGPSECFYTGNPAHDRDIVADIVELAATSTPVCGNGYASFGVPSVALNDASALAKNNSGSNMITASDQRNLIERIVADCKELAGI